MIMNEMRIRVWLLALGDCIALGGILLLTALIYRWLGGNYELSLYCRLWPLLLVFVICNGFVRLYHGNFFYPGAALGPVEELRRLFFSITLTYLLLLAYLTIVRNTEYSRLVLLASWAATGLLLPPGRWLARAWLKKYPWAQGRVLIAGAGHTGSKVAAMLEEDCHFGFRVAGFVDDAARTTVETSLLRGKVDDAIAVARRENINYLICCLPLPLLQSKLRDFAGYFRHILIVSDTQTLPISWSYPLNLHGIAGVELRNQLQLPGPRLMKRLLELSLSLTAIVLLLPLFLLLALLVKLSSPGPIFYRARRLGLDGRTMRVWKFRTMYEDADDRLESILAEDPELARQWRLRFKLDHDPRITPLGKFLRKSSLDELPQFFNVLHGEMAVIGPRPIVEAEKVYYGSNYEVFARVKPGITGLWQVSGRSDTTYERRVDLDMHYVMNWSVWLDFYILLKTVLEVFRCRGAK